MKQVSLTALCAVLCIALSTTVTHATDLLPLRLLTVPVALVQDSTTRIRVTVRNQNVLDAVGFSITVKIKHIASSLIEYNETVASLALAKFTDSTYAFPLSWRPANDGPYIVDIVVTYAEDIDPSNNTIDTIINVEKPIFTRYAETAQEIVDYLKKTYPAQLSDTSSASVVVLPQPLPTGTKIQSYDSAELNMTLNSPMLLCWFRPNKFSRYASNDMLGLMADTGKTPTLYPITYWPLINGVPIQDLTTDSLYRYGSAPTVKTIDSATIHSTSTAPPVLDECAILVSGQASDLREQLAFNGDVEIAANNLIQEQLGPHLKPENVMILLIASPDEIQAEIAKLKGKCRKIWFFYSGHGDTIKSQAGNVDGYMVTHGHSLFYDKLFDGLFATGASELTIIVDACHSGSAIDMIKRDSRLADHDVNLITACQTGETSKSYFIGEQNKTGFGGFTLYWMKAFGDPAAETDGTTGISEQEATDLLRLQNPEMPNGEKLLDQFHPRTLFHRNETKMQQGTPVPVQSASVTVTPTYQISADTKLGVSVSDIPYGYELGTASKLKDSSIESASNVRLWNFSTDEKAPSFSFDLEFKIKTKYDSLYGAGTPGLMYREDSSKPWGVYTPYNYYPGTNSIKLTGVNHFSEWALAMVTKPQAGVRDGGIVPTSGLRIASNPVRNDGLVLLDLGSSVSISIRIYDELGHERALIASGQFPSGSYPLVFSTHGWSNGYYRVVLECDGVVCASESLVVMH